MSLTYVDEETSARQLAEDLKNTDSVAVDCEAAGFHRYSDRLCLVQLSTKTATYIVDPLALDVSSYLRPALEDPEIRILMHGSAYDLRLLARDLNCRVTSLFDTQVAASLTAEPGVGLQALLEKYLDVKVSKKYQRADWAQRPLTPEMLDYAASDTRHLHDLVDAMTQRLRETGRTSWAEEEFVMLDSAAEAPEPGPPIDPVTKVKGARALDPLTCAALRETLDWRDQLAQKLDRAPFRVSPDSALLLVAQERPTTVSGLSGIKGMSSRFADSEGPNLLARLRRVEELPEEDLIPYPRFQGGPSRPTPEVEVRFERLKKVRNQFAENLGLDRGRIIANHLLMEIAQRQPSNNEELRDIASLRTWQADLMGPELLAVVPDPPSNN